MVGFPGTRRLHTMSVIGPATSDARVASGETKTAGLMDLDVRGPDPVGEVAVLTSDPDGEPAELPGDWETWEPGPTSDRYQRSGSDFKRPSYMWAVLFGLIGGGVSAHVARKRGINDTNAYWVIGLISGFAMIPLIVLLVIPLAIGSTVAATSGQGGGVSSSPKTTLHYTGKELQTIAKAAAHTPADLVSQFVAKYPYESLSNVDYVVTTAISGHWDRIALDADISGYKGRVAIDVFFRDGHIAGFEFIVTEWQMEIVQ